jgi:TIR domain
MGEEMPPHIGEDRTLLVPSEELPSELTLVSFRRDLLLMPSIMLSRFPHFERSRPVRLTGVTGTLLELTEDEINLLGTRQVITVANGGFVHILPNSERLREAKREASAALERALNPEHARAGMESRTALTNHLVVIAYANHDRAYADLLAGHIRACSIDTLRHGSSASIDVWHYVPDVKFGTGAVSPLEYALRNASALAVLMSPHSSASWAVQQEVQFAMANGLRILPILLVGPPLTSLAHLAYFDATSGQLPPEKVLKEILVSP